MEENSSLLQKFESSTTGVEEGISILNTKSRIFPAKCLGCGTKHTSVNENNMMMGSDGRYYKVDMRHHGSLSDHREVFGVTPSQLALYENSSTMKMKRSRVVSTTRPNSSLSKTNLMRPTSAQKYWLFIVNFSFNE